MTEQFRYWAFLSYSHANEAFARRLHRALEHYTIPRRLRRAHGLPRRLIPVFRDVEELEAASALTPRLQDALEASRWLIVLCSRESARSKYVDGEIAHFVGRHGARRVLCALVDGEPADAFPPAIKSLNEEPLAADFRDGHDFDLGVLKLVAAMAVVGFTELRNREAQRRRRNRVAAAAAIAALGLGATAYWDLFQREHVDYYVDFARRNGIWEGHDRLSAETASHRIASYRFTRRGRLNPPERVDYVTGNGRCAANGMADVLGNELQPDVVMRTDRYCSASFSYARDGAIQRESLLNELGKVKLTLAYTVPDLAQFTQEGFAQSGESTGINYVQFSRDEAGRDREIRFLFARDVPRATVRHEYGFRYEYDAEGREIAREILDDQGHGTGELRRVAYSATGDPLETRYEDASGHLRVSEDGYAVHRFALDRWGNTIRESFLSTDRKPVLSSAYYASRTMTYDDRGNDTEVCYFDENDQPIASPDTSAECERSRHDAAGNMIWLGMYGHDGKPSAANNGYVATTFEYHDGMVTETRNIDEHANLVEDALGIAMERYTRDRRGNIVDEYLYGADGKPGHTNWGAKIHHAVDASDRYTEFAFFDADGQPMIRPDAGYAALRFKRDERGNIVEAAYFGTDLKPIRSKRDGGASLTRTYDDQGNQIEERHFDVDRSTMKDKDGVAIYRRKFDALGHKTEETYFDEQERPTRHKEGYFGLRLDYDHRGRVSRKIYLDAAHAPAIVAALGGAGVQYEYDPLGRIARETYLGVDGAPLTGANVDYVTYARNQYGEELERRYYGAGDVLTASPASGCAIQTRKFDSSLRLALEQCLDARAQLHDRKDGGWAQKQTTWDHGQIDAERYLDAAGRPVEPKT